MSGKLLLVDFGQVIFPDSVLATSYMGVNPPIPLPSIVGRDKFTDFLEGRITGEIMTKLVAHELVSRKYLTGTPTDNYGRVFEGIRRNWQDPRQDMLELLEDLVQSGVDLGPWTDIADIWVEDRLDGSTVMDRFNHRGIMSCRDGVSKYSGSAYTLLPSVTAEHRTVAFLDDKETNLERSGLDLTHQFTTVDAARRYLRTIGYLTRSVVSQAAK